jgi:hypothetical protein
MKRPKLKRPVLNEIPLGEAMQDLLTGRPALTVTMSRGQWDRFLEGAYQSGATLLELDQNEVPVRAYRRGPDS